MAADSERNLIFVPQVYTSSATAIPLGDQNFTGAVNSSPTVGQLICGTTNGCIAVYAHHTTERKATTEMPGSKSIWTSPFQSRIAGSRNKDASA